MQIENMMVVVESAFVSWDIYYSLRDSGWALLSDKYWGLFYYPIWQRGYED